MSRFGIADHGVDINTPEGNLSVFQQFVIVKGVFVLSGKGDELREFLYLCHGFRLGERFGME